MVFDAVLKSVMWELGGQRPTPEFMFRRCSALVASVPKFGTHMSGSAIDISVMHLDDPSREVDRGAPYLEMSALTPMGSPFVSDAARRNRQEITALMRRHGFVDYPWEFWHYSSGDAYEQVLRKTGRPAIYGAVQWDPRHEPGHAAAAARAAAEQLRRDPRRDRRRAGAFHVPHQHPSPALQDPSLPQRQVRRSHRTEPQGQVVGADLHAGRLHLQLPDRSGGCWPTTTPRSRRWAPRSTSSPPTPISRTRCGTRPARPSARRSSRSSATRPTR